MGCAESKEIQVATPPASAPAPARREAASASTSTPTPTRSQVPSTTTPSTAAIISSAPLTKKIDSNGDAPPPYSSTLYPTTFIETDLNDVVRNAGEPWGRGRFLSYASGASTPNTSSGNISWEGGGSGDDRDISTSEKAANILRGSSVNPKVLKTSGSAIGLDEIHQTDGAGLTSKVVHIEVPFGKPIEEVYDGVHNGPVLGSGVSGLVRLVMHKATGVEYAVKCLDLGLVGTKEGLAQLREEIFIMCQLDHPNIVRLEEVYESHSEIYLVQELCVGGELFDRLDEQPDYHYTEAECARLVKQMLSAVRYLHSKGIIHRDLKLENFLFSSKAPDSELKMIDFGLSKHYQFGEVHHEAVGTPYTVAPEVIHGSYDERCDIWAIGVISFLLLSGDPPFGGCGGPEPLLTVRANILAGKYKFEPEDIWEAVTKSAKEFVKGLLVVDPKNRPTAREAQKHAWLKEWASRQSRRGAAVLNPNVVKALVSFKEFSHMRKLLSEVLSFTLLPDQIKELRKEFEIMDTDGSGEISLTALKQVLVTNAGAGSLGALTEEEVEDIFNAMRVNKAETRIHWHEFIAAGLSQCRVDDRNLRLAFDRLDGDHKGYITLDDIMNLVGNDELHSEEHLRIMWRESMRSVNCTTAHITYDNFLLLMKGQTTEPELPPPSARMLPLGPVPEGGSLGALPECGTVLDETLEFVDKEAGKNTTLPPRIAAALGDSPEIHLIDLKNSEDGSLSSLPNMTSAAMFESISLPSGLSASPALDSPSGNKSLSDVLASEAAILPEIEEGKPAVLRRGRSKSLAGETEVPKVASEEVTVPTIPEDSRRALALPERDSKINQELAKNQSALVVNRQLYRAHRQMRLSVLDASLRFEEEQKKRARDTLMAQKTKEAGMMGLGPAGLVMRHGHKVQVTTDNIRQYMEAFRAEQQQLLEKATRRGGRGRGNRKKTISDMSAMMNASLTQDEMVELAAKAARTPEPTKQMMNASFGDITVQIPDLTLLNEVKRTQQQTIPLKPQKATNAVMAESIGPSVEVVDKSIRKATVPGQFHLTKDPFSTDGMYGGARIGLVDVDKITSQAGAPKTTKD